jgi:hypothetical protein
MGKGVEPEQHVPLTDEQIADVIAGHPHESTLERKADYVEFVDLDGVIRRKADGVHYVERTMRSATMAQGKDPYVTELLNRMAILYAERNAVYQDNYLKVGAVMAAMFPEGKVLKTADDFNRWHLFELAIVKLTRYANQYEDGGHADSIEDMIVYLAMVAGLDHVAETKEPS